MDTTQIYTLVNQCASESMGSTAVAVRDTSTLVSLGTTVLSSQTNTEAFLNTLTQMIGKNIIHGRKYRNKFGDINLSDFEYGAIVRKISVEIPDAVEDPSYDLTDGESIDPWTIKKPTVKQKLFVTRTPYMFSVTISRELLKEAFTNEAGMESLISYIFSQTRNAIELSLENLGRSTYVNYLAEVGGTGREIKLLTLYKAESGDENITAANALLDQKFMAWAMGEINSYIDYLTDMSKSYNDGSISRFTPYADQRLKVLTKFIRRAETTVQYAAFNEKRVSLSGYEKVNYWQGAQTPMKIMAKRASDGTEKSLDNIVAVLHDRDALGTYKHDEDILTTPVNAKGRYYNTFYHQKDLWFNDLSENFLVFTLN